MDPVNAPVDDCVFCRIVAGESPASVFYDDALILGFMDLRPVTPGHALIIPKRHAAFLAELDETTGQHMWTVAQRTAAALRRTGLHCEGVNLFLADGKAAGQEVFHVHLHVFPRYEGDGFRLVGGRSRPPSRDELNINAEEMRRALRELRNAP